MGGAEWSGARGGDMGDERQGVVRRGREGMEQTSEEGWEVVERERADEEGPNGGRRLGRGTAYPEFFIVSPSKYHVSPFFILAANA